jgi:hypothetical protein
VVTLTLVVIFKLFYDVEERSTTTRLRAVRLGVPTHPLWQNPNPRHVFTERKHGVMLNDITGWREEWFGFGGGNAGERRGRDFFPFSRSNVVACMRSK